MPELAVGYHKFSNIGFFNYQLNRWHGLGYTRREDIDRAGREIKTIEDNQRIFTTLAEEARKEGRLKNAAFYYRAAEFLTDPQDANKAPLYRQFNETFYEGFKDEAIEQYKVEYKGGFLPAMRLAPVGGQKKGVVVVHGGFDSFIEEFFCVWKYFSEIGYETIAFDGPGQGGAHRLYNLPHEHDWEKPVGAILDYFNVNDVTLVGLSFGGYWCLRAAAFEKRIKRVIVDPPFYDLMDAQPAPLRAIIWAMIRAEKFMDWSIRVRMKALPTIAHVVRHCLYINNKIGGEPMEAAHWLLGMNKDHLHSELVDQDVLLLASEKDNFQNVTLYRKQMAALKNARSITGRVFTRNEQAENHCQIGNLGLALRTMGKWLEEKS